MDLFRPKVQLLLVIAASPPPSVHSARSKKSPVDKPRPLEDQGIVAPTHSIGAAPPPSLPSPQSSSIVSTRPSFADASRQLSTLMKVSPLG